MRQIKTSMFSALMAVSSLIFSMELAWSSEKPPVGTLAQQLETKNQQIKYLQGEVSFTQQRRTSSQVKLRRFEQEIEQKNKQLKLLQSQYAANPSEENEQSLRNEQQRIELAELSVKSRVAAVVRLEAKEIELKEQLVVLEQEAERLSARITPVKPAVKVEPKSQDSQTNLEEEKDILTNRLLALQRENERLRQVALTESQKREQAESQAALTVNRLKVAELAMSQYQGDKNNEATDVNEAVDATEAADVNNGGISAREMAQMEMERVNQLLLSDNVASSPGGINLYLKGRDGTDYGSFQYLGAQQYRADVVMHAAESVFRIGSRLYKVTVAESDVGSEFVFLYDLSNNDSPRFVTFQKSLLDDKSKVAAQ